MHCATLCQVSPEINDCFAMVMKNPYITRVSLLLNGRPKDSDLVRSFSPSWATQGRKVTGHIVLKTDIGVKKTVCHRKWSTNNGRSSISFHIHVNLLETTALETRTDAVQSPMLYLDPYYPYWFPANISRINTPSKCWDGQWSSMVEVFLFFFFPPHPHICTDQTRAPLETTKFAAIYLSLSPS